jgi:hypothetical protein
MTQYGPQSPYANISLTTHWSGPTTPGMNGYGGGYIYLFKESSPGNNDFSVIAGSSPTGTIRTTDNTIVWNVIAGINYKISVNNITCVINNNGVTRIQSYSGAITGIGEPSNQFLNNIGSGAAITVSFD